MVRPAQSRPISPRPACTRLPALVTLSIHHGRMIKDSISYEKNFASDTKRRVEESPEVSRPQQPSVKELYQRHWRKNYVERYTPFMTAT
jgi:hypothetical protein